MTKNARALPLLGFVPDHVCNQACTPAEPEEGQEKNLRSQICRSVSGLQTMSAIKLALQQNQKRDRRKTSEAKSAEVSPDSKCPICLDVFNNIAYLDICLHKFCFRCIHEWSKNKAECPLCKQPFNSIYHSIKSEQDFKHLLEDFHNCNYTGK
uniref:E3 ubiquitin-protein ligase Topors n=1 Tax=Hippocampus comes TaxID=109280 RepID=A0A3Q2XQX6_HIPCM